MGLLARMSTFVHVVEAGSLSAAARRTRLSLPAVSRQLAQLEHELGTTLVLRTTRKLTLTEPGRAFYERCVRILREVEDARAEVRGGEAAGVVVLSAPVSLGLVRIAPEVEALLAEHPRLRVDLRLEDRVVDLLAEGVDVAIRAGVAPPDSPSIVAHAIGSFRRLLVASPRYLAQHGRPREPATLARHQALVQLPAEAAPGVWTLRRADEEVRVAVRGAFRTNALLALRDAAIAGRGIALLGEPMLEDALAERRLVRVLPDWEGPEAHVHALHHVALRRSARVRAVVEHLRAAWRGPERRTPRKKK